jgi:hypothetical protein
MSAIPATERKLRHARETFQLLQASARAIPLDREEVERRLSDFLSAAYSVEDVLKDEIGKPRVDRWLSRRDADDRALHRFMRGQRRPELHHRGAAVNTAQKSIPYIEYLQRTEAMRDRRHPDYHAGMQMSSSGPFGLERPPTTVPIDILQIEDEEAAEKCARCLRLLEQMVQAFLAARPTR